MLWYFLEWSIRAIRIKARKGWNHEFSQQASKLDG